MNEFIAALKFMTTVALVIFGGWFLYEMYQISYNGVNPFQ